MFKYISVITITVVESRYRLEEDFLLVLEQA